MIHVSLSYKLIILVLFGTNLSNELFEYAKAVGAVTKDLKKLLIRNVDAIFDDSLKPWLRETIEKYRC
jgi:predicted nucleotidyltransferase